MEDVTNSTNSDRKEQHAAASTSAQEAVAFPRAVIKRLVKSKLAEMSEGEKGELQISRCVW